MPKPPSAGTHVDRAYLSKLWTAIQKGKPRGWKAGMALEYLIVRLFEIDGAKVSYSFNVPSSEGGVLEQFDGFIQVRGISALLEMKDYSDKLNVEPLAKLRNQLARRPAGLVGCVFSRGGYTKQAISLASYMAPQAILLWTAEEIDAVVRKFSITEALEIKYSRLLRDGMSYFDFRGELSDEALSGG